MALAVDFEVRGIQTRVPFLFLYRLKFTGFRMVAKMVLSLFTVE